MAARLALAAGYEDFGKIEALGYTFRVSAKGKETARVWKWWPREDRVRFTSETGEVTEYRRDAADRPEKIDRWFINDQYWLLFPLHLRWDPGLTLETFVPSPEMQAASGGKADGLRVIYNAEQGYTPGDIYELFYNEEDRIVRWIFRRGGQPAEGTGVSWGDYRTIGPLTISLDHRRDAGDFRLWFEDVSVDLKDRAQR